LFLFTYHGFSRWPLHYACRTGNYEQVQYLVESLRFDINRINEPDDHDATPLYLAALTGRTAICQLLLQRGAICTENDSARVFYVALTPSLRALLREWSLSAASRDPLVQSWQSNFRTSNPASDEFVSLCSADDMLTADCVALMWIANVQKQKAFLRVVLLHRIVLQFRCPYLYDKATTPDNINHDTFRVLPSSGAFREGFHIISLCGSDEKECQIMYHLLEYLYTGTYHVPNWDTAILSQEISRTWNLLELSSRLERIIEQQMQQVQKPNKNSGRQNLSMESKEDHLDVELSESDCFANSFRKCDVSDMDKFRRDLKLLAHYISTAHGDFQHWSDLTELISGSDLTLVCHSSTYSVHRFRWMSQSDYFHRALQGHFAESSASSLDLSHMVPLEASEALPLLIQWMYADCFQNATDVSIDIGMCVIQLGMALLCPSRLSNYVVNAIFVPNLSMDTIWDMLEFARTHSGNCDRLEEKCCEVIAMHLDDIEAETLEFRDLIVSEALSIRQGGDVYVVDVPLVAEVRRAIYRLDRVMKQERLRKVQRLKSLVEEILEQEQLF
jgi:Ankyrin repeats (3 copies)/BTB/POZ domain